MRKKASVEKSRLNHHGRLAGFALVSLLVITACYPGEITSVGQLDVVVTTHDETVNFASFQTFAIPDTVIQLGADDVGAVDISHQFDELIVDAIIQELEDLGYVHEGDPVANGADFLVLVTAVASREVEAYQSYPWYDYWGYYPGWGYPGWGYGPGWGYYYPPTLSVTSYEQGTLFIDILDVNNPDASAENLPIAWTAAVRGVLGTSASVTQTRLVSNIDRAFSQSPYLGR